MRSPTNAILTGLAIADLLVMVDYIPFSVNTYLYKDYSHEEKLSYPWSIIIYFHAFFSQTGHTISIFLTVTLAVWRYIAIAHPQKNRAWCNMRNTLVAIIGSYICCALLGLSTFGVFKIREYNDMVDMNGLHVKNITWVSSEDIRNVTVYRVAYSDNVKNHPWIWQTYIWIFSILIKIIPSIALTVLSLRLVGALLEAKRRRKHLMGHSNGMRPIITKDDTNGHELKKKPRLVDKERQTDRTTRMLLAVLLLFLITEFPQGILSLISGFSQTFYNKCNLKLGELDKILRSLWSE